METQVEQFCQRLEQAERDIALIEMVESSIIKKTFHFRCRKFVESLIKQRQLIIDRHVSLKNTSQMLNTIDHLKVNLDAASPKDRTMARYFLLYEEEIRSLIPGSYPNKRFDDFISFRDQAREINSRQLTVL